MPYASRRKAVARFQVQVEDGRMNAFAFLVRQANSNMRFKGEFVGRESHIAVNPKQRTPARARIGHEMRVEFPKVRNKSSDESQGRVTNVALVMRLVPGKPFTVVVALQPVKKRE